MAVSIATADFFESHRRLASVGLRRDACATKFRWLARRRAFRGLVAEQATLLIAREGKPAYSTARALKRLAVAQDDYDAVRLWAQVSREIAERIGYELRVIDWIMHERLHAEVG